MLVTGSAGLIGSEIVRHFDALGWVVHGADNNGRADFFGPAGDTRRCTVMLLQACRHYAHHDLDVRDRVAVEHTVAALQPDAIVHAAAQPSHDLAARRPYDDFDTNAVGTLNMLEAARRHVPGAPFVHLSTNKVYGDAPNELPMVELATRWEFERPEDYGGIRESMRTDQSLHSLFGASKLAGDMLVQEYGRYHGMPTCCLRGGCLTGPQHAGVELHGFLSYLIKCCADGTLYRVYGYGGKQVRDNCHAADVARFAEAYIAAPRPAEVYNIGGGRPNSCSVLEAFALAEAATGKPMHYEYIDQPRLGDHRCYISDITTARTHDPGWAITKGLIETIGEIAAAWRERGAR